MIKNKVDVLVIGAGAAGLGAAAWLKTAGVNFSVMEAASELPLNLHNGVHYLHSIPELPFSTNLKEITLTDGIVVDGKISHIPNLEHSLKYSEKVREIQHPSSIMNVGKTNKVYMPKNNSVNSLLKNCYKVAGEENFNFGYKLEKIDVQNKIAFFHFGTGPETYDIIEVEYGSIISAVPLDKMNKILKNEYINTLKLECTPIHITNYELEKIVPNWMINLYIPDPETPIYRASILNGVCSVESIKELTAFQLDNVKAFLDLFHFKDTKPVKYTWNTGKVISISMDERRKLVKELQELSIYQIGRFGLWNRKLLIDSTIKQAKAVVDYLAGGFPGAEVWNRTTWKEVERLLTN